MTTSAYTLIDIPNPQQTLVHVHPSGNELGSVYRADLPINATAETFADLLDSMTKPASIGWSGHRAALREAYEAFCKPIPTPGAVRFEEVVRTVSDMLPENGIVTNGAGNYAGFVHRYIQYKGYRSQLAPTSGSMGYGLPAAIAAKLADPTRTVINFAGDGCFLMTGQELATACQYGLNVVTIIANNGMYGTIRAHQEKQYPARVVGTTLMNPDFAAYARSFGAHGETVLETSAFKPALERALAAGKPAIIEVKLDPEALTPKQTLSEIRAAGKAAQ
jgi:acetolactate synthase-1/2/3 large subunit